MKNNLNIDRRHTVQHYNGYDGNFSEYDNMSHQVTDFGNKNIKSNFGPNNYFGGYEKYNTFEDNEDNQSGISMTNSQFMVKLKSNKKVNSIYNLNISIEKIFKKRKSTVFYKIMGLYGKISFTIKTMKIFEKIFKQMILKRKKIGMVKIKRIWYFGRMHDRETKNNKMENSFKKKNEKNKLYHYKKDRSVREFHFNL